MAADQQDDDVAEEQRMLAIAHLSREGIARLRWSHTPANIIHMNQQLEQSFLYPRIDFSLFDDDLIDGLSAWQAIKQAYGLLGDVQKYVGVTSNPVWRMHECRSAGMISHETRFKWMVVVFCAPAQINPQHRIKD